MGPEKQVCVIEKFLVMEVVIIEVEQCHCYFCHEFLKNFCVAEVGLFISSELVTKFLKSYCL